MALIASGFHSEVTLIDQGGNKSTLSYEFNAGILTFGDALTAQLTLNTGLNGVTTSVISQYSVCQRYKEDSLNLPVDAQNENKASVSFTKSGGGIGNLKIPAPIEGMFVGLPGSGSNNNIIDLLDPFLVAYYLNFQLAGDFFINDGETLIQAIRGKRIHAKSNNG